MRGKTVNINAAKTQLSRLIARVERGERIVITRAGKPVAELRAVRTPRQFAAVPCRSSFRGSPTLVGDTRFFFPIVSAYEYCISTEPDRLIPYGGLEIEWRLRSSYVTHRLTGSDVSDIPRELNPVGAGY
jgi:antitoxin (DNA-binding transcriptional repressor) of toxin-antitoxin stability system